MTFIQQLLNSPQSEQFKEFRTLVRFITLDDLSQLETKEFFYVAQPYADADATTRTHRLNVAQKMLHFFLFSTALTVFVPIAHRAYKADSIPHRRFMELDIAILQKADALIILDLTGSVNSRGVDAEVVEALATKKPIYIISPDEISSYLKIPWVDFSGTFTAKLKFTQTS